jgi:quercetin dioxygenase-like cupin family protein
MGNVVKYIALILLIAAGTLQLPTIPKSHAEGEDDREWSLVLVELAPGDVDARHFHPGFELMYVLEGVGNLEVDGEPPMALNPGTVAALPQDRRHVLKNTSPIGPLKVLVVFFIEKEQERFPSGLERGRL